MSETPRSGFVALVGRPNVGKSTFLNGALGQKLSITSNRPQTTRNRVVGIYNGEGVQAVLVDTPGHHQAWSPMNRGMVRIAESVLSEVDLVVLIVDLIPAVRQAKTDKTIISKGERVLVEHIKESGKPCLLALNKTDAVEPQWVLPVIEAWSQLHDFTAIVPVGVIKEEEAGRLLEAIVPLLPEGQPLYPTDQLTDSSERFVVSELIREKLFRALRRELPYSVAVQIEDFKEQQREGLKPLVTIFARILVERKSQKGIVIGKGGSMLKRVGTEAREDIERLLSCRVDLKLHVSVSKGWSENPRVLAELGISNNS